MFEAQVDALVPDRYCYLFGIDDAIVASVGGALVGGVLNNLGQSSANSANVDLARENNATAIELANSQYQRAVKDLKSAGLNPVLAATVGGNAVPTMQMPPGGVQNTLNGFSSSAGQIAQTVAQLDNIAADTNLKRQQTRLVGEQSANVNTDTISKNIGLEFTRDLASTGLSKATYDMLNSKYRADLTRVLTQLSELQTHSAKANAAMSDIDASYYLSGVGKAMRMLQLGSGAVSSAGDALGSVAGGAVKSMIFNDRVRHGVLP